MKQLCAYYNIISFQTSNNFSNSYMQKAESFFNFKNPSFPAPPEGCLRRRAGRE